MGGRPGQACPRRLRGLSTGPAHSSAGTRQRPSSAPLHQPSPSTRPLSCLYAYAHPVDAELVAQRAEHLTPGSVDERLDDLAVRRQRVEAAPGLIRIVELEGDVHVPVLGRRLAGGAPSLIIRSASPTRRAACITWFFIAAGQLWSTSPNRWSASTFAPRARW